MFKRDEMKISVSDLQPPPFVLSNMSEPSRMLRAGLLRQERPSHTIACLMSN